MVFNKFQRFVSAVLVVAFLGLSIHQPALATIVTTDELITAKELDIKRDQIREWLARDEVKDQLVSRGVDPQHAQDRVASMTDTEVIAMAENIDDMPAGSGALGLLVLIFVILIITDLAGVTDVFPFIKKR